MDLQTTQLKGSPEKVVELAVDAVWLLLEGKREIKPLDNEAMEWIDWRLRGQISRALKAERLSADSPTIIASMRRLGSPYVVVEAPARATGKLDLKGFEKVCTGLKFRRVLVICENDGLTRQVKAQLTEAGPQLTFLETAELLEN